MSSLLARMGSRKLLAFAVASALLALGLIDQGTWLAVACTYVGGQAVADAARYWRRGDDP